MSTSEKDNGQGWCSGFGWQLDSFTGPGSSTERKKGTEEPEIPSFDVDALQGSAGVSFRFDESALLLQSEPQNFHALRDENLQNRTLFEDPEFPATVTSLHYSPKSHDDMMDFDKLVWLRPKEIVKTPQLFVDGYARFDVKQGTLGNCWAIAAMAQLAMHPRLFVKVVPDDQSFEENYAGIFHFKFWHYGKWVDVVIDDRLATHKGELVYANSKDKNEFWVALLEKAYAKYYGSYEALEAGASREAMQDFTGGVCERFKTNDLKKPHQNGFKILLKAFERGSLMTAIVIVVDEKRLEAIVSKGLRNNHGYTISSVKNIRTSSTAEKTSLIRLRNPWGNETEWNGAWSDNSTEWENISENVKKELGLTFDHDGEFWMAYNDFKVYFAEFDICNLNFDSLSKEEIKKGLKKWEVSIFEGVWVPGVTAGGPYKISGTFSQNPQYLVTLTEPDEDDDDSRCTLIVSLTQKHTRVKIHMGAKFLFIAFSIYYLSDPKNASKPLNKLFFVLNMAVGRTDLTNVSELTCRFKLPCGTYCVVPWTEEPNQEGSFMLRVFSERKTNMGVYDDDVGFGALDELISNRMLTNKDLEIDRRIQKMFLKFAGQNLEVNWQGLKEILDATLKNETRSKGVNEDICRSIVGLLDKDNSGKLDFEEFKRLWSSIKDWTEAFKLYDVDKSDTMNSSELREAFNSAGYRVNNKILIALVHRYGNKNNELTYQTFILCALKMKALIEMFKSKKDDKSSKAKFSFEEWMLCTLDI